MHRKTPHDQHDEITLRCLDCAAANPGAYRRLALADARRILATRPTWMDLIRIDAELDRWAYEDRHRDADHEDDWADLPWWRRTWARITGRR